MQHALKTEGTGVEPATDYSASDFESVPKAGLTRERGEFCAGDHLNDHPKFADPGLAVVVAAWGTLSPAVRAGIFAMVKASG